MLHQAPRQFDNHIHTLWNRNHAEHQAHKVQASARTAGRATYQRTSLVVTIPCARRVFGPFCHFALQNIKSIQGGERDWRKSSLTSLPRLNSLNQEPGFSFAQDVSLVWGHRSMRERHGKRRRRRWREKNDVKERKHVAGNTEPHPCFLPSFVCPPRVSET